MTNVTTERLALHPWRDARLARGEDRGPDGEPLPARKMCSARRCCESSRFLGERGRRLDKRPGDHDFGWFVTVEHCAMLEAFGRICVST